MQQAESLYPHARAAKLALTFRTDLATAELFARLGRPGSRPCCSAVHAIAERLYEPGERSYGDTDVLVDTTDQRALEGVLGELGYATYIPGGYHWRRIRDAAEVDVHHALSGARASPAALWKRLSAHRSRVEVGGATVPTLDLEGTAVVIALHAAHHGAAVPHTLVDLERALSRFDLPVWSGASVLAGEVDGLLAFRQGLSMLPAGTRCLSAIGLAPAISVRSSLRRRGIELPFYLNEALSPRERLRACGSE